MKEHKIDAKIEALWDDWTDIEVDLLEGETEDSNNLVIEDNIETINLGLKDYSEDTDVVRSMKLMIPEYSSLDMEFRGSIEQRDTQHIDSKMKGTIRVISDDTDPESKVTLKRVKTESGEIKVDSSDLIFTSYWETKEGTLTKTGPGIIEMKRFGVSYDFQKEYHDTTCKIKTVFTNPRQMDGQPDADHRLDVKCSNSRTEYGMFRGSIDIKMDKNSYFKIDDGNIDAMDVEADSSTLELYINEMHGHININLKNGSKAIIKVNPDIEFIYRGSGLFNMTVDDSCSVDVSFEQVGSHLFGDLMKKYGVENVEEYSKYKNL